MENLTASLPRYEIYALKYAERETTACQFFYREASEEPITLHFYFWLIRGGPYPVLLDTGFSQEDAATRGVKAYVSPASMLERAGVKATEVPVALISHLHWDHWGGYGLFPNATFWIQREEVAFFTGPIARFEVYRQLTNPAALGELVKLNYAGRVKLLDGDTEILPGVRAHWVGGHTAGLQIVTVPTARGQIVLTSDASHFYRNIERRQPVQIITSLPQMLLAFEKIEALAGSPELIVAGHDPLVATRFQLIEPGVIKIA
jgi:glyoxylase-like metal-dependent hydrolase (beta-lactamase superfamily II)